MAKVASGKRQPRKPTIDRTARADVAALAARLDILIEVVDELIDFVTLARNSLDSLWVEVECMQTREKVRREAKKLERELGVK